MIPQTPVFCREMNGFAALRPYAVSGARHGNRREKASGVLFGLSAWRARAGVAVERGRAVSAEGRWLSGGAADWAKGDYGWLWGVESWNRLNTTSIRSPPFSAASTC